MPTGVAVPAASPGFRFSFALRTGTCHVSDCTELWDNRSTGLL